jgi:hypothetical protein
MRVDVAERPLVGRLVARMRRLLDRQVRSCSGVVPVRPG